MNIQDQKDAVTVINTFWPSIRIRPEDVTETVAIVAAESLLHAIKGTAMINELLGDLTYAIPARISVNIAITILSTAAVKISHGKVSVLGRAGTQYSAHTTRIREAIAGIL